MYIEVIFGFDVIFLKTSHKITLLFPTLLVIMQLTLVFINPIYRWIWEEIATHQDPDL